MSYLYALTGDAERQWEKHVDQEALEVVYNILICYSSHVVFMYIVK